MTCSPALDDVEERVGSCPEHSGSADDMLGLTRFGLGGGEFVKFVVDGGLDFESFARGGVVEVGPVGIVGVERNGVIVAVGHVDVSAVAVVEDVAEGSAAVTAVEIESHRRGIGIGGVAPVEHDAHPRRFGVFVEEQSLVTAPREEGCRHDESGQNRRYGCDASFHFREGVRSEEWGERGLL